MKLELNIASCFYTLTPPYGEKGSKPQLKFALMHVRWIVTSLFSFFTFLFCLFFVKCSLVVEDVHCISSIHRCPTHKGFEGNTSLSEFFWLLLKEKTRVFWVEVVCYEISDMKYVCNERCIM
jgi:hypothetical protein